MTESTPDDTLPSILVVDDEDAVAFTLCEILTAEGYRAVEATSVASAVAAIERDQFDGAVLDLNIGTDSGLTVLTRLHERSPHTAAVILTGFGSLDTAVQAMRSGAFDYLIKPCDVTELKATLRRGIAERRAARHALASATVREELEQALAVAERARDDFLTITSHELKTPLAALIGWAQLAQRQLARGSSEGAAERLDAVVQQAQRVARLVEAFTELVSIRQGSAGLIARPLDLAAAVKRSVDASRLRYPGHTFMLIGAEQPLLIETDARAFKLVLENLFDNAAKFSPGGGVVEVSIEREDGFAMVCVRDHGIGLTSDELAHVFDRFYQADGSAMSRRFGGIGAGNFVSRALIEAQGGRISAQSDGVGHGSTFVVSLPAPEQDGPA